VPTDSLRYLIGLGFIAVAVARMARKPADWRPWGLWGWPPRSSTRNAMIYVALAAGILDAGALWFSLQR
jgi:hypothetical protein